MSRLFICILFLAGFKLIYNTHKKTINNKIFLHCQSICGISPRTRYEGELLTYMQRCIFSLRFIVHLLPAACASETNAQLQLCSNGGRFCDICTHPCFHFADSTECSACGEYSSSRFALNR